MNRPKNPFKRWRAYESENRPVKGKRKGVDVVKPPPKRATPLTPEEKLLRAIFGEPPSK